MVKYQDELCIFQGKRDSKETRATTSTVRVTSNWRQLIIKTAKTSTIGRKKTKVCWDLTRRTTHVDDDRDYSDVHIGPDSDDEYNEN